MVKVKHTLRWTETYVTTQMVLMKHVLYIDSKCSTNHLALYVTFILLQFRSTINSFLLLDYTPYNHYEFHSYCVQLFM